VKPTSEDVAQMAGVLTRISRGIERARRRGAASTLGILWMIAGAGRIRPSEIADALDVHQSSITRQVRALEAAGQVELTADPRDRRSCFITLTDAGRQELARLNLVGVGRFARFVADWDAEEVQTLSRLLLKLESSIAEVHQREESRDGRDWQKRPPVES